jgi:phosphatidylglycerophosphate synthase
VALGEGKLGAADAAPPVLGTLEPDFDARSLLQPSATTAVNAQNMRPPTEFPRKLRPAVRDILRIYRLTRKPKDLFFNTYVCRPLAAAIVYALKDTRVTPNQVTFFSLLLAACSFGILVGVHGALGLWLGILVYEVSYLFDCADGMLARHRSLQSQVGHLLDFLMDEIKAFFMLAAVAAAAFHRSGDASVLAIALLGLACLASGIGLTTFMRRPEVAGADFARRAAGVADPNPAPVSAPAQPAAPPSVLGRAVALAERVGKLLIHYPSYIWLVPVLGEPRVYLYPYVAVNAAYMLRALASTAWRYGRFAPPS